MSRTSQLVCHDCKAALWVGQKSNGKWWLYKAEPNVLALEDFFEKHINHRLEFGDDEFFDDYECTGEPD